ncbi:hypothetical protein Tco_0558287 [Tanacetum coccineum]
MSMVSSITRKGCDAALETLPADMKAGEKAALMKKAYITLIQCLGDRIERWDKALMVSRLPSFYENFVETLLYGRKSLTMEDVLATLNSRELKKRTEGTKEERSYGDRDVHLKRDVQKEESQGGSSKKSDNRTCTIKGIGKVKIQLHDGSSFILEDVRYVSGLRRNLISLGTLEKEGYTIKMQMGRIKESMKYRMKNVFGLRWNYRELKGIVKLRCFRVPGQEGAKGNVAEKKKVRESMEANLGKLLKCNT